MPNDSTLQEVQTSATETNNSNMLSGLVNSVTDAFSSLGSTDDSDTNTQSVSYIPKTDFVLLTLAKEAVIHWQKSSFTLLYTNPDDFMLLIDTYEVKLASGRSAKAERTPTVDRLKQLREMIDQNIGKIKSMLQIDFGRTSAVAHYTNFGIQKYNQAYIIPQGYDETLRALKELLSGLDKYGYADQKYGTAFWQPIYDEYVSLAVKNKALTGSGSAYSGDKNVVKEQVSTVLRSLLLLLQANYPDTWQNIAREWGFLRERY